MFARIAKSLGHLSVLTALGLIPCAVNALTISPVIVELSPARRVVSITVTNPSELAMSFQAEVLAWHQTDGQDSYEETTDLIVVPPIAEIAPGASQIFRVTTRVALAPHEQAYRLILEDVTEEAIAAPGSATVNIRIRHSLPVFVATSVKPRMEARLGPCPSPASGGCVRLDNVGDHYLSAKTLSIDAGTWHTEISLGTRVLAGAWRQWTFAVPKNLTAPLQVRVDTTNGSFVGEIPPTSPR